MKNNTENLSAEEKSAKAEQRTSLFAVICGLVFAGAFLAAFEHINDGNLSNFGEVLSDVLGGAALSVILGLAARYVFTQLSGERRVAALVAFIVVAALLGTFFARYMSHYDRDFQCSICEAGIGDEAIDYGTRRICSDCFSDGVQSGELGYCENCQSAEQTEYMKNGLCENCYDAVYYPFDVGK